jgi:hypothetical protein
MLLLQLRLPLVKAMVTTTAKCNVRGCGTLSGAGPRWRSHPENLSISDPENTLQVHLELTILIRKTLQIN